MNAWLLAAFQSHIAKVFVDRLKRFARRKSRGKPVRITRPFPVTDTCTQNEPFCRKQTPIPGSTIYIRPGNDDSNDRHNSAPPPPCSRGLTMIIFSWALSDIGPLAAGGGADVLLPERFERTEEAPSDSALTNAGGVGRSEEEAAAAVAAGAGASAGAAAPVAARTGSDAGAAAVVDAGVGPDAETAAAAAAAVAVAAAAAAAAITALATVEEAAAGAADPALVLGVGDAAGAAATAADADSAVAAPLLLPAGDGPFLDAAPSTPLTDACAKRAARKRETENSSWLLAWTLVCH